MYLYLKKNDFLDMLKFSRYYDMSYLHMHEISLCSVLHILEKYVYIVYAQKWVFICRKKETHTYGHINVQLSAVLQKYFGPLSSGPLHPVDNVYLQGFSIVFCTLSPYSVHLRNYFIKQQESLYSQLQTAP